MTQNLSEAERRELFDPLLQAEWRMTEGRDAISKRFLFASFVDAFGWMTKVAIWGEKWNHHPEWSNVYGQVDVVLTTHDAQGLTALDAKLARKMDSLA